MMRASAAAGFQVDVAEQQCPHGALEILREPDMGGRLEMRGKQFVKHYP